MVEITAYIEGPSSQDLMDLPWQSWFETWGKCPTLIYPQAQNAYELTIRLTNDQEIQSLNSQYRDRDQPTDVLAFANLEDHNLPSMVIPDEPIYLGDIIISVDTARQQSQERGHNLKLEIAWLSTHGFCIY